MGAKIGEGNTAEIYLWGEKEIIKLFHSRIPAFLMEQELAASEEASHIGLPVPKVLGKRVVGDRSGIVYEKIAGESLTLRLVQSPEDVEKLAKEFAELHFQIHQITSSQFFDVKTNLIRNIQLTDRLTSEQKNKICRSITDLPNGGSVCHMDFHPDNILCSSSDHVVIDWMTVGCGDPFADVARTVVILRHASLPHAIPQSVQKGLLALRNCFCDLYVSHYLKLAQGAWTDIEQWFLPIMAARLIEGISEEETKVLHEEILSRL